MPARHELSLVVPHGEPRSSSQPYPLSHGLPHPCAGDFPSIYSGHELKGARVHRPLNGLSPRGDPSAAADADRESVAEKLRIAAAEGRIGFEELDDRLGQALSGRTYGRLRALIADLPVQPASMPQHREVTAEAVTRTG